MLTIADISVLPKANKGAKNSIDIVVKSEDRGDELVRFLYLPSKEKKN